jgi:hypothetical protein
MKDATLSRIRKLLSLAHCPGATPAEAASAIQKASALAEKEGLSLGDIPEGVTAAASPLTHTLIPSPLSTFRKLPAHLIARQIGVKFISFTGEKSAIIFIGLPHQVTIAVEAYRFLIAAMEAAWKRRPDKRMKSRTAYAHGFCEGVAANLAAAIQRPGLIVAADAYVAETLTEALNATITKRKSRRRKVTVDTRTYQQGITDGRRTTYPGATPLPKPKPRIPSSFTL